MSVFKPTFANLVASPTDTAWAQAYTAGSLFGVLSLSSKDKTDDAKLKTLGKEVFNVLQAEFFPLEEKNLENVRDAIATSVKDIPADVSVSFVLGFQKEDLLYVFIYGGGKVLLKRKDQLGRILSASGTDDEIKAASGKIEEGDMLILQTKQFSNVIPEETLQKGLESSVEASAEGFMPKLHGQDDGGAAALFAGFTTPIQAFEEKNSDNDDALTAESDLAEPIAIPTEAPRHFTNPPELTIHDEIPKQYEETPKHESMPMLAFIRPLMSKLGPKRLILIIIATVLVFLLVGAVISVQNQQKATESHKAFLSTYNEAKKHFDEGQDLLGLNDILARDDFTKAKEIIESGRSKILKDTEDEQKLNDLLSQVNNALGSEPTGKQIKLTESASKSSPFLEVAVKNPDAFYIAKDDDSIYFVNEKAIYSIPTSNKPKEIIKNDSDWENLGGLSAYNGNIYLLDKDNGILKFVSGSDGYGKADYFTKDTKPDLTTAVSMAIDGSVWILYQNGSIMKFTKGSSDTFNVTGLIKPAVKPMTIATNADMENLYILDQGAGRVIVIAKDGIFKTQYQSDELKKATNLDVSEKDKKAYVIIDKKIFELTL